MLGARMRTTVRAPGAFSMHVYSNALEMIGHTPMLQLQRMDAGPCELFLKLEMMNPGGGGESKAA